MTPDNSADNSAVHSAARSMFYQQLSRLFAHPSTAIANACVQTTLVALRERLAALPHADEDYQTLETTLAALDRWVAQSAETSAAACLPVYTALFDNCTGRAAVPLYEKEYGNGDAKMVWEELIRFYEHFGLQFDVRQTHDWPDHIGTELEFMHYLCYRQATADPEQQVVFLQGQRDFLQRRLSRWAGRFAAHLNEKPDNAPYGFYARLVDQFICAEMRYLDIDYLAQAPQVPLRESASGHALSSAQLIPVVEQNYQQLNELHTYSNNG